MELWIRSQDKTFLKKVNTIGIVEGSNFWFISENLTADFGKYKTKERALEVLDEIQDVIDNGIKETRYDSVGSKYYKVKTDKKVYEMPEE